MSRVGANTVLRNETGNYGAVVLRTVDGVDRPPCRCKSSLGSGMPTSRQPARTTDLNMFTRSLRLVTMTNAPGRGEGRSPFDFLISNRTVVR